MSLLEGGFYSWGIPVARTIAGYCIGVMLGIIGGWLAVIFINMIPNNLPNQVIGNIYLVSIGIGAGIGAYLGWMNLATRWYFIVGSIVLVLLGGIVGVYTGMEIGQNIEPSYLGRAHTIENTLHWGAPVGAIIVATIVGVFNELRTHQR
ncbi:MAG: hypothetical protein ACE5Q6_20205 [Dehalococcoidia bacterium]